MERVLVINEPVENVFCPTGPGGGVDPTCPKGGHSTSASVASDFNNAPNTHSTSPEAKKWRKKMQEKYDTDPEFRAVADAATLFTQGDYAIVRAFSERAVTGELPQEYKDSSLPNWVDKPLHPNPLGSHKDMFEGQGFKDHIDTPGRPTWSEAGSALSNAVQGSAPSTAPIYRGIEGGRFAQTAKGLKPGDPFDMLAPMSFTTDGEIAGDFAAGIASGQRRRSRESFGTVIEIKPGARTLNVAPLSPWKQKEVLTAGKFKVESVDDSNPRQVRVILTPVE